MGERVKELDVTALARAVGEARRAKLGLPVAMGMQGLLSIFALQIGDRGPVFAAANLGALITAGAAAIVAATYDAAAIRGRKGLRAVLFVFIAVSLTATAANAYHVVEIVRQMMASGKGMPGADEALDPLQIFVGIFALSSWLIVLIDIRAGKLLAIRISGHDAMLLKAAPGGWSLPGMDARKAAAALVTCVFGFLFLMVVGLLRNIPLGQVIATIDEHGLSNMALELVEGVRRGETAAIGVLSIFLAVILILLFAVHRFLAPSRSPLNHIWRWAKDANAAIRADTRAPILLLRSFNDDALFTTEKGVDFATSVEGAVFGPVAGRGPFLAVGIPGEAVPAGRAYRAYLKDDEWQGAVLRWMEESQMVVVILGLTPWARWELEMLRDRGYLTKTRVLLPPARLKDRAARWENFASFCKGTAWQEAITEITDVNDLLLAGFEPDGEARIARSQNRWRDDYYCAMLAALPSALE